MMRMRLVEFVRPYYSRRRQVEGPGEKERDRETERKQDDDESHRPHRDFEKRKDLRRDLNEEPAHDRVGHGDAVNFAALEFGEKLFRIHTMLMTPLLLAGKSRRGRDRRGDDVLVSKKCHPESRRRRGTSHVQVATGNKHHALPNVDA